MTISLNQANHTATQLIQGTLFNIKNTWHQISTYLIMYR